MTNHAGQPAWNDRIENLNDLNANEEDGTKDSQLIEERLETAAYSKDTGICFNINSHPNGK